MKTIDFNAKYLPEISLALGFFDCVHLGHAAVIGETKRDAASKGCECAVMTFKDDINRVAKQIYTFNERRAALENLGVDVVIAAEFDAAFAAMPPERFIQMLTRNFCINAVYVGEDYTFGAGAKGDAALLVSELANRGIRAHVMPFVNDGKGKISASGLKKYVKEGDVEALNAYLSEPYFMIGKVVHARHMGTSLGFPTANLALSDNRLTLADGIYASKIAVESRNFFGMTNIGGKPTFADEVRSAETYIFDFDKDIYGKDVKLSFFKRTRDVIKFDSPEALQAQLREDEKQIRRYFDTIMR